MRLFVPPGPSHRWRARTARLAHLPPQFFKNDLSRCERGKGRQALIISMAEASSREFRFHRAKLLGRWLLAFGILTTASLLGSSSSRRQGAGWRRPSYRGLGHRPGNHQCDERFPLADARFDAHSPRTATLERTRRGAARKPRAGNKAL